MDHTDSIIYDTFDSEVGSISTPKNLDASENDKEAVQSADELSSFDISDDNNPLKQKLEQMSINDTHESNNDCGIDFSTNSSRHTSLNADTAHHETNIMETPSSIFTYKTNTTRPSSRGATNQGYLSDRFEQRLDTAKAILLDTKLHEPEVSEVFEENGLAKNEKDLTKAKDGKEEELRGKSVANFSEREEVSAEENSGSSPKRLHRIVSCNHSDTDTSSHFDSSLEVQTQHLGKILDTDSIYDSKDRISNGAEITRLTKELTHYKVQIQLQQEIINNNLLKYSDQPVSKDLLNKLKTLSINERDSEEHKKYVNLETKYKILMEDITELQQMNAQLIEDQEKEQINYEKYCVINSEILTLLQDLFAVLNLSNLNCETKKNDLESSLKQVLNKVRMVLNKLQSLDNTDAEVSVIRDYENSVLQSSPVHTQEGKPTNALNPHSDALLSFLDQLKQENSTYLAQIKSLKQVIFGKDQKIEKQNTILKSYKHSINEFVSLLQQTLNGYINEFIGFHSDFLSSAGRIFEQKSINEVFAILKKLVVVSDDYQNKGALINFQSVRSMMSPVWHHNNTVALMLIKRYELNVEKLETETKKSIVNLNKENDLFKFKAEMKRYQDKISDLELQIKNNDANQEQSASNKPSIDSTLKLRLDVMTKKWKQAHENLAFERRTSALKIRELEGEIERLKSEF